MDGLAAAATSCRLPFKQLPVIYFNLGAFQLTQTDGLESEDHTPRQKMLMEQNNLKETEKVRERECVCVLQV